MCPFVESIAGRGDSETTHSCGYCETLTLGSEEAADLVGFRKTMQVLLLPLTNNPDQARFEFQISKSRVIKPSSSEIIFQRLRNSRGCFYYEAPIGDSNRFLDVVFLREDNKEMILFSTAWHIAIVSCASDAFVKEVCRLGNGMIDINDARPGETGLDRDSVRLYLSYPCGVSLIEGDTNMRITSNNATPSNLYYVENKMPVFKLILPHEQYQDLNTFT